MSRRTSKSPRGCLFYGCATVLVLMIAGVVATAFLIRAIPSVLTERYTSASPMPLPSAELKASEYTALTNRVADFAMAYVFSNAATLKLTGPEINTLMQGEDNKTAWKEHVRFELKGGDLITHFSIPSEMLARELPWKSLGGRYLNGRAVLEVGLADGGVGISLKALRLNGKDVPGWLSARFRGKQLLRKRALEPKALEFLERIESIEVRDGMLILRLKGFQSPPESLI